jgi:Cytochrome c
VAGSVLPCAGCHGRDRRGRPEGGVTPPDLTWAALGDPEGATTTGRHRPPYTERLLKRAITLGLDPGGQPLQVAMPRYQMTQGDMADLLAYLRTEGPDPEPGLTEGSLTLGVLLPPANLPETSRAVREALASYFAGPDVAGGLYGRKIEPRFVEAPSGCGERAAALRALAGGSFALIAPFVAECEGETLAAAGTEDAPVVGPLALAPPAGEPSRLVFFLDSGLAPGQGEGARALASWAAARFPAVRQAAAIVHLAGERGLAAALLEEAAREGWEPPRDLPLASPSAEPLPLLAAQLRDASVGFVFFLGPPGELSRFRVAARVAGWRPRILVPGAPATPESAAASALAAAKVFVEAARRSGRELTRDRLVASLEGLYRFATDSAPPVTFGPGRRVGVHGLPFRFLDLGPEGTAEGGWIELD